MVSISLCACLLPIAFIAGIVAVLYKLPAKTRGGEASLSFSAASTSGANGTCWCSPCEISVALIPTVPNMAAQIPTVPNMAAQILLMHRSC